MAGAALFRMVVIPTGIAVADDAVGRRVADAGLAAALVAVLAIEWLVLKRIPRLRDWFGLPNFATTTGG